MFVRAIRTRLLPKEATTIFLQKKKTDLDLTDKHYVKRE